MFKLSITLLNQTEISFESDEAEELRKIVIMALRGLPRDLIQSPTTDVGQPASMTAAAKPKLEPVPVIESPPVEQAFAPAAATKEPSEPLDRNGNGQEESRTPPEFDTEGGQSHFVAFCQKANPMGDMRRVVVATEGANRHFGVDGVSASDLSWLSDFVQPQRNASRTKFGWLERAPGRSGRYSATPLGLSKVLNIS